MSEVQPVLLYEGLVSLDGAVVGVNDQLGQGAGLTGAIPAIRAVNHSAHATGQGLRDEETRLQHSLDMLEPPALVNALEEVLHGVYLQLTRFYQLTEGVPHDVDVLYSFEHELGVGIEGLRFVAFPPGPVGHGVDLGPGVHYEEVAALGSGVRWAGGQVVRWSGGQLGR